MSNIKKEILSGVLYTAIAKYSGLIISWVITGVLARLIDAQDFGIIAVTTVFIIFFSIYADVGISPAIIQYKDLTKRDLDNIFSFTAISGVVLSAIFFAVSGFIGDWYESSQITFICRILTVNLLFASLNIVPSALMYRDKRFKFIAVRTLAIQIVVGTAAITYAYMGGGLYALLVNPIVTSIALFVVNFVQYPRRFRLTLGLESMKKIYSYSAYQFLFNTINYFSRNLDKLLVGKFINLSGLGFYEKSYQLMMVPIQNLTHVISPVLHPVMTQFKDDHNMLEQSYRKIIHILAMIGFPLSVVLHFVSREAILIVFGSGWESSVSTFSILSLSVGFQIVLSTSGAIFQSAGATRNMFISGLLSTALTVTGILFAIFSYGTIEAVAYAIAVTFAINFFQSYIILYVFTFKVRFVIFLKQLLSPLFASTILFVVLMIVDSITVSMPLIVSAVVKGGVWLIVMVAYVQLSGEYDVLGFVRRKLKR